MADQPTPISLPPGASQVLFAPDHSGVQIITVLAPGISLLQSWPRDQLEGMLKELVRRQLTATPEEMANLIKLREKQA